MSLFDQHTVDEQVDDTQYNRIREELIKFLEEWWAIDSIKLKGEPWNMANDTWNVVWSNPSELKTVRTVGELALQYIWKKMGKKIPKLERNEIDDECKLIN